MEKKVEQLVNNLGCTDKGEKGQEKKVMRNCKENGTFPQCGVWLLPKFKDSFRGMNE